MQTISEEYLLGVLQETLHPTQSSTFLSGSFYEELEKTKGYLETLMKIVYNPNHQPAIRQLAVINIKNCIQRKWWSRPPGMNQSYLSEEEKESFTNSLMSFLAIPLRDASLINQLSIIIARVARVDYPNRLGNYFTVVQSLISSSDLQIVYQGINSLLSFIRTFSTCRIGKQRQLFLSLLPELLSYLMNILTQLLPVLKSCQEHSNEDNLLLCEILHCTMSALYKVIIRGIMKSPNTELQQSLSTILPQLLTVVNVCLSSDSILINSSAIKAMKWCLKINDEYCSLQKEPSPFVYQSLGELCLNILFSFYSSPQTTTLNELIPILTVINHSLSFLVSQSGKVDCIQTLFNDECLLKLLQCIHTSMFCLSSHQIELLQQNNDEFYWDYTHSFYRSTVISLYEVIAKEYPQQTANYLLSVYRTILSNDCEVSLLFHFLCMLERGSGYLIHYMNYQEIFSSLLLPILSNQSGEVLVMMESALVVKCCYHLFSDHEQMIQIMVSLLSHSSVTIQLTAVECLSYILQTYPTAKPLIHCCFTSIVPVTTTLCVNSVSSESKSFVLTFLTTLLEKLSDLQQFCDLILSSFSVLWSEALNSYDLSSLLLVLRLAVTLVKYHSFIAGQHMNSFFELVVFALQKAGEDVRTVLLEESLILWNLLLKLPTIDYNEGIHNLFTAYLDIYSCDKKYFTVVMNILDLYIQLGKNTFLDGYLNVLPSVYYTFLQVVTSRELPRLVSSLHSLLLLYPSQGIHILSPLMDTILLSIVNKHREVEQIEKFSESFYVNYLVILCQLLLNQEEGLPLIGASCQKHQIDSQSFFGILLSSLLDSFDSSGGGALGYLRRTLFVQCMLLCLLNGDQNQFSLFEEVCDCIVNVMSEREVGEEKMRLLFSEKSYISSDGLSEEYLKKFMAQSDLRSSFHSFLQSLKSSIGDNGLQELFRRIDPLIYQPLSTLISV